MRFYHARFVVAATRVLHPAFNFKPQSRAKTMANFAAPECAQTPRALIYERIRLPTFGLTANYS